MATTAAFFVTVYHALFADITSTRRCGTPVIEKRLCASLRKRINHDRKAVAVTCAEGYVVDHQPREISGLCYYFIKHGGEINGKITGGCCVRGIALAEIRGFPNFRVGQQMNFFGAC